MASPELKVKVIGDASSFQKAMRSSSKAADGFGKSLGKMGKMAAIGTAAAVGVAAVAVTKFTKAAMDLEKAMASVKKMLENNGISWAKHGKQIDATIQKHAALTGFDDEELAQSFANMVRTTGKVSEAFKLNALAADVARAKGMNLAGAQSLLARVYNGSYMGLKRLGIAVHPVTAAQDALKESTKNATVEQKRAAKEADNLATRTVALGLVQKQFGGQAEAYGKTAAGAIDRFHVAFENLEENLGSAFLPVVTKVAAGTADFLNKLNNAEGAGAKFDVVVNQVKSLAGQAWDALKAAFNAINWGEVWDKVSGMLRAGASAAWSKLDGMVRSIDWGQVGTTVGNAIKTGLNKLSQWINQVNWNAVGQAAVEGFGKMVKAVGQFLAGVDWAGLLGKTIRVAVAILKGLGSILLGAGTAAGAAILSGMAKGLSEKWGDVKTFLASIDDRVKGWFTAAGTWLYNAGVAVLSGFFAGLKAKWEDIKDFVSGIGGWIQAHKGPPAQDKMLLVEAGNLIMQGLKSGMESGWQPLEAWLEGRSGVIVDKVRKLADAVRSAQGSYRSAWDDYTGQALAAFDDMASKLMTQSERLLAGLSKQTLKLDKKQAKRDVRDAGDNLAAASQTAVIARAGAATGAVSPEDLKKANDELFDAQMAYDRAVIAQKELTLGEKAAKERAAQDEKTAADRMRFEKDLAGLTVHEQNLLLKHGSMQRSIVKKIKSFDKDYQATGVHLGEALVAGLNDMRGQILDAALDLQRAINNVANIAGGGIGQAGKDARDRTRDRKPPGFAKGVTNFAGGLALVGEKGPELVMLPPGSSVIPNAGNGSTARATQAATTVINAVFPGFIGNKDDLRQALNEIVRDQSRRNGGSAFAGMA